MRSLLNIKWDNGVTVKYNDVQLIFDPQGKNHEYSMVFITHAHYDHAKAFSFSNAITYSTRETFDLVEAVRGRIKSQWRPIHHGKKISIGSLILKPRNAGHILGSSLYEVTSPEGSLIYTGDINCIDTYTMSSADVNPCDVLIIESTFGSPRFSFQPYSDIVIEMVEWAIESISKHRIPVIQADSLGNDQEIIRIFNTLTTIPVITHASVTRINKIYESYGHLLYYEDMGSDEAKQLLSSGNCIFVAPKRANLPDTLNLDVAYASGWASYFYNEKISFPLSDHADYEHLLAFVEKTQPKLVLTFHGGRHNSIFAEEVARELEIKAFPLDSIKEVMLKEGLPIVKERRITLDSYPSE